MLAKPRQTKRSWTPVGAVTFVGAGATGLEPVTPSLQEINGALNTWALRDLPQCLCGFDYWLLLVVLCCYVVAGAPEVPLRVISPRRRFER